MQTTFTLSAQINFTEKTAKPFMKWAGGKGQLIESLVNLFPAEIKTGEIKKYAEPFMGGGALFFYVAQNYPQIEEFYISDANQELALAYTTIQKDVESLISLLAKLEKNYHALDSSAQKDFFYEQRKMFNEKLLTVDFNKFQTDWIERTAKIIFLNRTCFNGLFRVNSKGEFNVPFGDYKNPRICDEDNLRAVSALLQKTEIKLGDFATSEKFVDASTFVYFDPPYRSMSKTASFISYSKFDFGDEAETVRHKKKFPQQFQILNPDQLLGLLVIDGVGFSSNLQGYLT